jgi:hypothetical protein
MKNRRTAVAAFISQAYGAAVKPVAGKTSMLAIGIESECTRQRSG